MEKSSQQHHLLQAKTRQIRSLQNLLQNEASSVQVEHGGSAPGLSYEGVVTLCPRSGYTIKIISVPKLGHGCQAAQKRENWPYGPHLELPQEK